MRLIYDFVLSMIIKKIYENFGTSGISNLNQGNLSIYSKKFVFLRWKKVKIHVMEVGV